MINKGTVLLETDRLILRKFKYSDAEYMFKNWGSDPKVSKFLSWPTHSDVNVSQKIINNWIEEYNNNIYNWAIELKSIHEAIGAISIVELDEANEACEIGYCISSRYWNEGFTSEAFKAVINYLNSEYTLQHISPELSSLIYELFNIFITDDNYIKNPTWEKLLIKIINNIKKLVELKKVFTTLLKDYYITNRRYKDALFL